MLCSGILKAPLLFIQSIRNLELRTRPPEVMVKLSDPDWESKTDEALKQAIDIDKHPSQQV
jgi:hypothetical protein